MNDGQAETRIDDESTSEAWSDYQFWSQRALSGDLLAAATNLTKLLQKVGDRTLKARIINDLGVLATSRGDYGVARQEFQKAQSLDPDWPVPQGNLRLLSDIDHDHNKNSSPIPRSRQTRVAILSLLFNWPSTGGGTVHTAELARFLARAGYDVRHFVVRYSAWSIGQVVDAVDWPIEPLEFTATDWNRNTIQEITREAVDRFAPDSVIITDSWNFKPRLAEALAGHRYFLRLAAQECLCPLNNVRLLWDSGNAPQACPRHQLASPQACSECVVRRGNWSGSLHQAERSLAGFEDSGYDICLRKAFAGAAGILVVNPLIAEMVKPHAPAVHVVPSGFDPRRFAIGVAAPERQGPVKILFAGLVNEAMKGFRVLHSACRDLWTRRQDFRLLATADPPGSMDEFTELIGWQSQADLPAVMQAVDIVVCPTIAEEALGRTAVEAMGAGRPVIASRIGGLPFAILDEATGLLCEPADPIDLQRQIVRLLDSPQLREQLGQAGRQRFNQHYTWDVMLERHYKKLLGLPMRAV